MPVSLLLIEDNEDILANLYAYLEPLGYELDCARHGRTGLIMALEGRFDCIVLDVMLPGLDGVSLCRNLREEHHSAVPVLMLTARDTVADRVRGLEAGADDYLVKPFALKELEARIRALLRRSGAGEKQETNRLTGGNITLDLDARNAYKGSELVVLTAKEFDVIEFLMRNANRVYSREALLDTIWAYEYRSDIRTVDVHIRRLREKLEENPAEPKYILTKWGVGYYFRK